MQIDFVAGGRAPRKAKSTEGRDFEGCLIRFPPHSMTTNGCKCSGRAFPISWDVAPAGEAAACGRWVLGWLSGGLGCFSQLMTP